MNNLTIAFIGALVNSALYLTAVVAAGFITGHDLAWKLGIAAMGVTYLSYFWAITEAIAVWIRISLVSLSVVVGTAAGIALLGP